MSSDAKGLAPCPSPPNCVSSAATDPGHRIEPLTFVGRPNEAMERLRDTIDAMRSARFSGAASNTTERHQS